MVQVAKKAPVSPHVSRWTPPSYTLSEGPSQGRAGLEPRLGRPLTEFISLTSTARATSMSHHLAFDQGLKVTLAVLTSEKDLKIPRPRNQTGDLKMEILRWRSREPNPSHQPRGYYVVKPLGSKTARQRGTARKPAFLPENVSPPAW